MIGILAPTPWQMTLGERATLVGILSQLEPALSIEIGTAEGGSLEHISAHSGTVHSFDLVEPSLPRERFPNVTFHTGDSHALLPAKLAELAEQGRNVDFVLVDGDHTAEGVAKDLEDLLTSPAIGRSILLIHDTLNDIVREGIQRVDFGACDKVVHVDLDVVAGHLSDDGPFRHQLWGGLGVVVVDDSADASPLAANDFHDPLDVFARTRDALVGATEPAASAGATATSDEAAALQARNRDLQERLRRSESALRDIQASPSWRLTAPARWAKRTLRERRSG